LEPGFIVTLKLDGASFEKLHAWRTRNFPPAVNYLAAHLTLLHTVSAWQVARLREEWESFGRHNAVALAFTAPRFLGRGVAIEVQSASLTSLRARIMDVMAGPYTRQDQQAFRAHVTIQNKVKPEEARMLFEELRAGFEPWEGCGVSVLIWRYLGGPWEFESELSLLR
jgi:hypothetical protein